MMSRRREERRDDIDMELEDSKYKYYKELRDGKVKLRALGKYYQCPYCQGRNEYDHRELRRHAYRIGMDSKSASFREKARHLGLLKFLEKNGDTQERSKRSTCKSFKQVESYREAESKPSYANKSSKSYDRAIEELERLVDGNIPSQFVALTDEPVLENRSEKSVSAHILPQSAIDHVEPSKKKSNEEPIVWPWMAIVANIPTTYQNGRYVGESGRKLREEWASQGYNPVKVQPLWNFRGHSGYAIVEFHKNWEGFKNAMVFERTFEVKNHGKRDWNMGRCKSEGLYAWMARGEEYNSKGLIGDYLRKNADLKTISAIELEDKRKDTKLFVNLTSQLEVKKKQCEEIKNKISRTEIYMGNVLDQKESMVQSYNDEMKKMQQQQCDQLEKIFKEHEKSKLQLESQRQGLKMREKELREREALNENEKRKLDHEKKMYTRAILEQKKADENMLRLAEEQKQEKENLHQRIIELEKKLDEKQRLELQLEQMRGAVEVFKHMSDDGDMEAAKKLESIEKDIKEKEEELGGLEDLNQALIIKERKSNDELQDARKELINGLKESRAVIGVKRMGELDEKPFHIAAKRKYPELEAAVKAMELCSEWDSYIRDSCWFPFKIIMDGDDAKEIIDEEDEKLKSLKSELGDEVYEAVTTALIEMNTYNRSGRYPVPELWNCREQRKASLKEGVELLVRHWKYYKRKKN